MDPLTMGLIGGGASLLGSIFSGTTSAQNTQAQIQASEQEQATQNAFTERMSNTAYQRASADMTAAGLNPMMMFGSGSAASTPSGSSIQAPMPQTTSKFAGLGQAANQVVSSAVQSQTFQKMVEEIANLKTSNALNVANTDLAQQRTRTEEQETLRTGNVAHLEGLRLPAARFSASQSEALESLPDWVKTSGARAGYLGDKASSIIAPISQAVSSATGVGRLAAAMNDTKDKRAFRNWDTGYDPDRSPSAASYNQR